MAYTSKIYVSKNLCKDIGSTCACEPIKTMFALCALCHGDDGSQAILHYLKDNKPHAVQVDVTSYYNDSDSSFLFADYIKDKASLKEFVDEEKFEGIYDVGNLKEPYAESKPKFEKFLNKKCHEPFTVDIDQLERLIEND